MKNKILGPLSIIGSFMLLNVGSIAAQYCASNSNAPWELWIKNVRLNTINYESGKFKEYSSLGYSDYTNISTTLTKGMTYELATEPGVSWSGILPNAYCRVWIDWNQNRLFEDSELVSQNTNVSSFVSNLSVPITAYSGITRMRIALKSSSYATPCDIFASGEVEDYSVTVAEPIPQDRFDLAVVNLNVPANLETNRAGIFTYDVKNIGSIRTNIHSASTFLSRDTVLSGDDLLIHTTPSSLISDIMPNGQVTVRDTFILSPVWTSNSAYFIVKISPEYYGLNDANNTRISNAVNVSIPQLNCVNTLGNGTVLCYDNTHLNAIQVYVAEGDLIQQKTVNKSGILLNSTTVGTLTKDSILVINNQVVKKLKNGNIAFSKTITPSVLNRFSTINAAAEMTDGTFVLGGFQKFYGLINGVNYARDSLILINTDANLNFQDSTILFKNSNFGAVYDIPRDTIFALLAQENNAVVAIFNTAYTQAITNSNLNIFRLKKMGNKLINEKNSTFSSEALTSKIIQTNACGNNVLFSTELTFAGGKSSARGTYKRLFNLDSLVTINERVTGTGSADYYGSYRVNSYRQTGILPNSPNLSSNVAGDSRDYYNNFDLLEVYFRTDGGITFRKILPTIDYTHIIRTGDTTCLFVTLLDGKITLVNPDCNSFPNVLPDLTLSNLNVTAPSVRIGQILNFKADFKNIGTAAATGNFTVKSYLSRDRTLSSDDYQDGVISTGGYAAGQTVLQVAGAMTVRSTNALDGAYYLILKIDADNQISEINEFNNVLVSSAQIVVLPAATINSSDLMLSITSTPSVYRQYSMQNFTISAKNTGNQAFTNLKMSFPYPTKTVNGGAVTASIGTWQEWCVGGTQCFTWTIPSLAANSTATLDVPVYVLDAVNQMLVSVATLNLTPNFGSTIGIGPANSGAPQPVINGQLKPLNTIIQQQLKPTIAEQSIVVELESLTDNQTRLDVINSLGNVVLTEKIKFEKGTNAFTFNVGVLPKGIYFIQTNLGNVPMKFVKM